MYCPNLVKVVFSSTTFGLIDASTDDLPKSNKAGAVRIRLNGFIMTFAAKICCAICSMMKDVYNNK